ncbi:unnamed protein product [Phyllotreta striolata]|uniref:Uncharacterized protein n=1 Tax=Phyllotreta striolata TaxID=444603 RepID=A0A9P0DSP4_PHYSR|nr:unnamed protein product [Phyllotreta striolata]
MQNAGQQYGQVGASSHQSAPYGGHTETTTSSGSITSSLRQFRRKNEDKQQHNEGNNPAVPVESHIARVAPHNHFPPKSSAECYRYPPQYPDYGLQQPVKYSEISESHASVQDHLASSVIQKAKTKEYVDMCNVQQQHMKSSYDHLTGQQAYDGKFHPHAQYIHKEPPQIHHGYKPESQYYPKEPQYSTQIPPQISKYTQLPSQVRKYPQENDFLSKLQRIHPTMARSIMSDHHLQESQSSYQTMDQNRMYPMQNQRYMNYPSGMQNSAYPHAYMPYSNYPASCSYSRPSQMTPRFPPVNPHERSLSPRRAYPENMGIPMNYAGINPQKMSPNYAQYNTPEYAQHYQHRRAPVAQEYYQQHCRPTQYLPHQIPQELPESRVQVSDSIKHYIENWADEETASEMNQLESSRMCKENLRGRDEQSTETVYMINASELQYLENEIPVVASENGVPVPVQVASESGQYIIKSGVSIVNGSEMMRIVEKTGQVEIDSNGERIVNLHIMDTVKSDCMLANKPSEPSQRQEMGENQRVVVHQNTVVARGNEAQKAAEDPVKVGTSLPIITDSLEEDLSRSIIKETADKNCSPINLEHLERFAEDEGDKETSEKSNENSLVEEIASIQELTDSPKDDNPFVDAHFSNENSKTEDEDRQSPNLEDDDPHKHIESLLKDTNDAVENIETQAKEIKQEVDQEITNLPSPIKDTEKEEPTKEEDSKDDITIDETRKDIENSPQMDAKHEEVEDITKPLNEETCKETCKETCEETAKTPVKEETCEETAKTPVKKETDVKKMENASTRRNKRIFSVDDIMNNIGKNQKQSTNDNYTRRHSLQTTEEFLDRETIADFSLIDFKKKITQEQSEKKEMTEMDSNPIITDEDIITDKDAIMKDEKPQEIETKEEATDEKKPISETETKVSEESINTNCDESNSKVNEEVNQTKQPEEEIEKTESAADEAKGNPQEVQYRNVIRVEESNVLLEIAGELVEINVNNVNGKNVITVTPLSDTTIVDFNDNYEIYDNAEVTDPLKLDEASDNAENVEILDYVEETATEPDVVETTSEIIIGMDLSLEEEIKLDVDQPAVSTKAAKKAYDCDLQIPSITTSEDILDNSRTHEYASNDKVSSTKVKPSASKYKKKFSPDSSKRSTGKLEKKTLLKDLDAARKRKKLKETRKVEQDEYVPFAELVEARKKKKLKLMKNIADSRIDSTIKIDENQKDDEKRLQVKSTDDDAKMEKSIAGNDGNESERIKKVTFSDATPPIKPPEKRVVAKEIAVKEIRNCKLEDPRLYGHKPPKKKLSLEEYNKRKRKLQEPAKEEELKPSKIERSISDNGSIPERIKPHRAKSLDENLLKTKDPSPPKKKQPVDYSPVKVNNLDWEETQSPKFHSTSKDSDTKCSEFKGLIDENRAKSNALLDINDLTARACTTESSEDEILQSYKVQVESKLSTLNIQIPKSKSLERQILDPLSKPKITRLIDLIDKFLNNEELSADEMDMIRKIISYKRQIQQKKAAPEARKDPGKKELKQQRKKVKKKARFRNLYSQTNSESESESEDEFRGKIACGDYSVVQSNSLEGVPKLIIKRKTEIPVPVVRLERLDPGILGDKIGQFAV